MKKKKGERETRVFCHTYLISKNGKAKKKRRRKKEE
jgi:hypothetical protein